MSSLFETPTLEMRKGLKQQVVGIIKTNIASLQTKDWDDLSEQIIFNFLGIDFMKLINDYQPCDENDLYVSESDLMEIMDTFTFYKLSYNNLDLPKNVVETSYNLNKIYNFFIEKLQKEEKKQDDTIEYDESIIIKVEKTKEEIIKEEITRFLETGTKILIRKQQNKYINTSFSTCPIPETGELSVETYYKLDKFVKNEKFNYLNKKGITSQINSSHAKTGIVLYNQMLRNGSPCCEIFASPANLIQLYILYLSFDGNMYILFSSYNFLTYYLLIKDDSWFRNNM